MIIHFNKYQGTGNDFIMLNNLDGCYKDLSMEQVRILCDRRFGVGADGLIRINSKEGYDFEMDYFNSDGSKSFCGNGARCSVAFAETLGIEVAETNFYAIDGAHKAWKKEAFISLEMNDVEKVLTEGSDFVLYTGSPHYIHFEEGNPKKDIVEYGKVIRYSESYLKEGINVNLVHCESDHVIQVQTYERGVEDETYSCGTGVTASAIATSFLKNTFGHHEYKVIVKGGELRVTFERLSDQHFAKIRLSGPATFVFNGSINV